MKLLFRLLRQNISIAQIAGFFFINLLGGFIVLCGVQGYRDFSSFANSDNTILSTGNIVITKPVTTVQTLGSMLGMSTRFSRREIDEIKKSPAVTAVGEFIAAQFEIRAAIRLGNSRMSTDIFLEAVPDEFIVGEYTPIGEPEHSWSAGIDDDVIPIILPRNYMNLYNFGFATSNGMPQISDDLLKKFPLQLYFKTPDGRVEYEARVCGLTNKINTILVPWDFMQAANARFAPREKADVSRLILKTNAGESNESLLEFLNAKGYVIEGDSSHVRLQTMVYGIIFVVIGIGALFSVLAFFMLVMSILLLIEKNKEKIANLFAMGYSAKKAASAYILLAVTVDVAVWAFAALLATIVYPGFSGMISDVSPGFAPAALWIIWFAATIMAFLFVVMHGIVIQRRVNGICRFN